MGIARNRYGEQTKEVTTKEIKSVSGRPMYKPETKVDTKISTISPEYEQKELSSLGKIIRKPEEKKPTFGEKISGGILKGAKSIERFTEPLQALSIQIDPTLGLLTKAREKLDPEQKEKRLALEEKYPKLTTTGKVASYIPVGIGASKLAGAGIKGVAKAFGKTAPSGLKGLIATEGLAGTAIGATEEAIKGEEGIYGGDIGKGALYGGAFGAGGAGLLGVGGKASLIGAGLGAGAGAIKKAIEGEGGILEGALYGGALGAGLVGATKGIGKGAKVGFGKGQGIYRGARQGLSEAFESPFKGYGDVTPSFERPVQAVGEIKPFGKTVEEIKSPKITTTEVPIKTEDIKKPTQPKPTQVIEEPTQPKVTTPEMPTKKTYKFEDVKTINDLPTDVDNLKNYVKEFKELEKKGFKVNLQLFAEAEKRLKKMSKMYENLPRFFTEEEFKRLDPKDFEYEVRPEKESLRIAGENIANKGESKVINDLYNVDSYTGIQTDEAFMNIQKLKKEGKWDEAAKLTLNSSEKIREGGRSAQALKKWYRTNEGKVYDDAKKISKTREDILKNQPKVKQRVDESSKKVKDVMDSTRRKAEDDLINESQKGIFKGKQPKGKPTKPKNENELAKRIIKEVNRRTLPPKEKSVLDKMINELYKKAKETMPKVKGVKPNPIVELGQAVKNRQLSSKMWQEAQDIVMKNFKGDKKALEILKKYSITKPDPTFAQQTLDASVNKALSDLNIKIPDIVRGYFRTGINQTKSLIEYIKDVSKADDKSAKLISDYVDENIKKRIREYSTKEIQKLARDININPNKKIYEDYIQDIEGILNINRFSTDEELLKNPDVVKKVNEKIRSKIQKIMPKGRYGEKKVIKPDTFNMKTLVKLGTKITKQERDRLLVELQHNMKIDSRDLPKIITIAEETFDEVAKNARRGLLEPMLKVRPKKVSKSFTEKMREIIDLDAYNDEAMLNLIRENEKIPTLTGNDVKNLSALYETLDRLDPLSWEYRATLSRITDILSSKDIPTLGEKIKSLRIIGMLSTFKTIFSRNVVGNALMSAIRNAKQMASIPADIAVSKIRGTPRTTYMPNFKTQAEGLWKGVKEVSKDIRYGVDTSPELARTMYDLPQKNVFKNRFLKGAESLVKKGLQMGDRAFYYAAENEALSQLAKRGIDPKSLPEEEFFELVTNEALKATYQDMNTLAKMFKKIKDGLNESQIAGLKGLGVGDIVQPFYKTVSGITTRAWDYSLGGIFDALKQATRIRKGGKHTFDQRKFVDALGRTMTAPALMYLGYELAKNGVATGSRSKDVKEGIMNYLKGEQSFSFKFGDDYYSFDWAQPPSLPLAMGVGLYEAGKTTDNIEDFIIQAILTGGDTLLENSGFKTYEQSLRGYGSLTEKIGDLAQRQATSFVPFTSPLRQARDIADPYYRQKEIGNVKEQVLDILPFGSKTLPVKYNPLGEPLEKYGGENTFFNVILNPARVSKSKMDSPLIRELSELADEGFRDHIPPNAKKSINAFNKETRRLDKPVSLNSKEISELQRIQGTMIKNELNKFMKSKKFKELDMKNDSKRKVKIMSDIISREREKAEEQILRSKGMTRRKPRR